MIVAVATEQLHDEAQHLMDSGFVLASMTAHDDGEIFRVVYTFLSGPPDQRHELVLCIPKGGASIPTLSDLSFPASRFEREIRDLFGIEPVGHNFLRPLVRHQHWPEDWHPMRRGAGAMPPLREDDVPYPFLEVQGTGVYEIPVGPIHAGLIEPGHFRFTVVGETILKMTARLWYLHRGVERLFEGSTPEQGIAIAERISGDSAVAHSLCFVMAVEEALGVDPTEGSLVLRGVLLELERLYNHVSDIGAMCNDVGFGVVHARALIVREYILRLNEAITGHRLLRGALGIGATSVRRLPSPDELDHIEKALDDIVSMAMDNTVLVDRFEGTARLSLDDAQQLGTLGPVARSSGIAHDARAAHAFVSSPVFQVITQETGDVMARFTQRVEEAQISIAMIRDFALKTTELSHASSTGNDSPLAGIGVVEGWRGMTVHRVELDSSGLITRCHVIDPSFNNWPAVSASLANTIVPDFPLANKSFNLSYSANDR